MHEEDVMGTIETRQRAASPFVALMKTTVSLWIVVVLMAMSFGAGVIVKTIAEPTTPATTAPQLATDFGSIAPPLTDDQLTGQLPEGHPDLSGDGQGQGGGGGNQNQGGGQNPGGQG